MIFLDETKKKTHICEKKQNKINPKELGNIFFI